MINLNSYESHVAISKELKMNSDFLKVREPYKNDFENIYKEAKEKKVNISNAKEFLNSLSNDELSTLQHYSGLADKIQTGKLTDEGAYNLLLHHYEKYDFDNDGIVRDGIAKTTTLIPSNMLDSEKKAFVETLNQMDEKEAFHVMALMSLPKSFSMENGELTPIFNDRKQDYTSIQKDINRILNPLPGEYTSQKIIDIFEKFESLFEKNYNEIKKEEDSYINVQNETNIIKAKLAINSK